MKYFACIKNPRHVKATAKAIVKLGGDNVRVRYEGVRISFESKDFDLPKACSLYNVKRIYVYS